MDRRLLLPGLRSGSPIAGGLSGRELRPFPIFEVPPASNPTPTAGRDRPAQTPWWPEIVLECSWEEGLPLHCAETVSHITRVCDRTRRLAGGAALNMDAGVLLIPESVPKTNSSISIQSHPRRE